LRRPPEGYLRADFVKQFNGKLTVVLDADEAGDRKVADRLIGKLKKAMEAAK
jgi:hypothetical protein